MPLGWNTLLDEDTTVVIPTMGTGNYSHPHRVAYNWQYSGAGAEIIVRMGNLIYNRGASDH